MDEREIRNAKAAVKKTPKIVRDYVSFLETTLANQYRISGLAVAKMRELAAIERRARELIDAGLGRQQNVIFPHPEPE